MNDLPYESYQDRLWSVTDIASAIGAKPNTLRTWIQRGLVTAEGIRRSGQHSGEANAFTTLTALELAITHNLTLAGLAPSVAREAGAAFAFFGHGAQEFRAGKSRDPGCVYDDGRTYVAVCPVTGRVSVLNDWPNDGERQYLTRGAEFPAIVTIEVTFLPETIIARLLSRKAAF
jgi:hypothetical protein